MRVSRGVGFFYFADSNEHQHFQTVAVRMNCGNNGVNIFACLEFKPITIGNVKPTRNRDIHMPSKCRSCVVSWNREDAQLTSSLSLGAERIHLSAEVLYRPIPNPGRTISSATRDIMSSKLFEESEAFAAMTC